MRANSTRAVRSLPSGIEEMLRLSQVESATGLSKSQIYLNMARNEFPKPVKVGRRSVAWPASVIRDWQRERIAERGKAA